MNITNDREVMIFRNDENNGKVKYTVGISKKLENGEYENAYFPIQFNKGIELEDKTKIKINTAWLSFYKWKYQDKEGTTFYIKCSNFKKIGQAPKEEAKEENDPFESFGRENNSGIEQVEISDDMLPF